MLMVCHHLDSRIPEDVAFAESRIRPETIAAEDRLHDLGAISMMSSDSQAMGRIGETITRTWQTAHKMKVQFGKLDGPSHPAADNFRALRYVSKYTICPAITHGIAHEVGSIEVGKLADLVIWKPAFFGVKPETILKGGLIAWANMGDPNASIPTPQPTMYRPAVRRLRQGHRRHLRHLRQRRLARIRHARRTRPNQTPRRREKLPLRHQDATFPSTTPCRKSPSIPTPTPSPPTAANCAASRSPCCPWPSGISCSEGGGACGVPDMR